MLAAGAELSAGAHYRVAFDNSQEGIVILQDGVVRVANPAAARISDSPLDQLIGASFLDFIHPDDQKLVAELYTRRLNGDTAERSMVARIVRPGGGILVLEAHSMPVQWDDRPAVLAFLGDVTDREQVRSDALEMSRRLARIAEVAPYFLFIYDYDLGRDVYINRSVPAALGYSPAEAAALGPYPFERLCHPDDMAAALDRDTRWQGFVDGSSLTVD
ncbi:MAG: PAS domain S-box protein, partial [Thermoanaerobaculia bacterium]